MRVKGLLRTTKKLIICRLLHSPSEALALCLYPTPSGNGGAQSSTWTFAIWACSLTSSSSQKPLLDKSSFAASSLLLPAVSYACTGKLPASRLEAHQSSAATHVTPTTLHGHQPASCCASSSFSVVQQMSERVLCLSGMGGAVR